MKVYCKDCKYYVKRVLSDYMDKDRMFKYVNHQCNFNNELEYSDTFYRPHILTNRRWAEVKNRYNDCEDFKRKYYFIIS